MADTDDEKGRREATRLTNVLVTEISPTAAAANRRRVTLKSEEPMAAPSEIKPLEIGDAPTSPEQADADLNAALLANTSTGTVAVKDERNEVSVAATGEGASGETLSSLPSELDAIPEVEQIADTSTPAPVLAAPVAPQNVDPAVSDEVTGENLVANVVSLALAMSDAANDGGDKIAIAKSLEALTALSQPASVALLSEGAKLPKVIRKSIAAALTQALEDVGQPKGELLETAAVTAKSIFKSMAIVAPAVDAEVVISTRLAQIRKCFATVDTALEAPQRSPAPRSAAPAPASTSRPELGSSSPPITQAEGSSWDTDINE